MGHSVAPRSVATRVEHRIYHGEEAGARSAGLRTLGQALGRAISAFPHRQHVSGSHPRERFLQGTIWHSDAPPPVPQLHSGTLPFPLQGLSYSGFLECPCRPNLPSSASYFSFTADPHPTHTMVPVSAGEARLDLRSVDSAVHRYYSEGLAATTKRCYSSGQMRFLNFCAKHQLQPLPPDESTILRFVSQLGLDGLSQATIQNYLGAIRNLLISVGMDHIQLRTPRVELVIRGIRRINSQEKNKKTRLPITPRELQLLKEEWGKKPITSDHTMLWAAACTGFFGFLRCVEFTTPSIKSFNAKVNLGLQDVSVQRDKGVVSTVVLHLKVSKTDQFGKGIDVYLTQTGASLCPVSALMAYLILRGPEEGPLFRRENGQPLT